MTVLLDANVLIALLVEDHVHHGAAENWFAGISGNFATCPITQGSLTRLLIREGQPASAAREFSTAPPPIRGMNSGPTIPYTDVPTEGIIGHRQMTDAYLAQLARAHGFRLATFDQAMAKLHHDVAELVRTAYRRRFRSGEARVQRRARVRQDARMTLANLLLVVSQWASPLAAGEPCYASRPARAVRTSR